MNNRLLLNADLGEGFNYDAEIMPLIDIANIACGAHAGNLDSMRKTLQLAKNHEANVSYHIGYEDRENFGRISIQYRKNDFTKIIEEQFQSLFDLANEIGVVIDFVKPHGALYHDLSQQDALAKHFIQICENHQNLTNTRLEIIGPDESALFRAARDRGFKVLNEAFVDRRYDRQGKLLPRAEENALITNPEQACNQARLISEQNKVISNCGNIVAIKAQTLCIHGDTAGAVDIARAVSSTLKNKKSRS